MSIQFDRKQNAFVGAGGQLDVLKDDEIAYKLAMLIEGECGEQGPAQAASQYGFSRQRYYQLRAAFCRQGAEGLQEQKRGPKTQYRRTDELVCQVIRHRFLDPDATSAVIAQKLRQTGFTISQRSVDRVIEKFGLQKKTLSLSPGSSRANPSHLPHTKNSAHGKRRHPKH